jgi:hypothetical protein
MMDKEELIAQIKQDLIRRRLYVKNRTNFQPAWKLAFYNPAKKEADGSVKISENLAGPILLASYVTCGLVRMLIGRSPWLIVVSLALLAAFIIYRVFFYKKVVMRIDASGITFEERTYLWGDYIGAYICSVTKGPGGVVLVRPDGKYDYVRMLSGYKINVVGTAIRDFQPAEWKDWPTAYELY